MYEKYLEQLEEAGKISYFLNYLNKNPEELTCQDVRAFLLGK